MKFSEAWLREWVDPAVSTEELAEQLTMAGLEVGAVDPVAGSFEGVLVGEVLNVEPHPNADKLRVCQVAVGQEAPLSIVCGAPNVVAGMRAPTAVVGAVLPGGFKIKRAKLRGVESFGMLCSAAELGLEDSSDGLMALPAGAPLGEDLRRYLELDDHSIELDLTPDRGDCLGVLGVAREVGVLNRLSFKELEINAIESTIDVKTEVVLEALEACPRYTCRVLRGVDPRAETPLWMRERLRRSGLRSLGPLVDVTNYVLLELGQPMHAFDLGKLQGSIQVRMARPGERLQLLDEQQIELRENTLLIADAKGPLAMAGIMGGAASGVSESTTEILLESAFFSPMSIIGKPRSYGLRTDSSHRFERGVDPELQVKALERATSLLLDIVGGEAGPVVEAVAAEHLPKREPVALRSKRVRRLLGIEIPDAQIEDILKRLQMAVERTADGWAVVAPSCRFDIAIEADLIEEIGRIYGYSEIPVNLAASFSEMHAQPEIAFDLQRAKEILVSRGYQEAVTYSFISPEQQQLVDPGHQSIRLANPIAADMSAMRTSLWPGLLQVARYNLARQQDSLRLFESGLRFVQRADRLDQDPMLAGLATGSVFPEQWGEGARRMDFFDLKADLQSILALTGRPEELVLVPREHPALHPGQSARVELAGQALGWIGMLHPELEKKLDLAQNTFLFEVRYDLLSQGRLPAFQPLSKFPSIRRDIALVMESGLSYQKIRDCITAAAPEILRDIRLFDVYTGDKIDFGRKSLALGLILQATSHTLTDEEVEGVMTSVIKRLEQDLGAKLRD